MTDIGVSGRNPTNPNVAVDQGSAGPITLIDLGVGGMTCDDCVGHVAEALEAVPGVDRVTVDLDSRSAVAETSEDILPGALSEAVRATGEYNAFERRRRSS